jgi:hypothetical protein
MDDSYLGDVVDRGTFEWVAGWEQLARVLSPARLELSPNARAVDIGCGNSMLPVCLSSMYANVIGIDREPHCAASMIAQHGQSDALRWETCDITATDTVALDAVAPPASVELVVDKGMLDCALTEDIAAQMLCNVARMLADGGVYIVISFRKPDLLVPMLSCAEFPWAVEHEPLSSLAGGVHSSICVMRVDWRNGVGRPPSCEAVRQHLQTTVDWWYQQEDPLLTSEREVQLREAWSAASAGLRSRNDGLHGDVLHLPADHLPLGVAYQIIFTDDERTEIDLDGFVSDVSALAAAEPQNAGARTTASPEQEVRSISLDQALAYLQAEQ